MNKTLVAFALLLTTSLAYFTSDIAITTSIPSTAGITLYGATSEKIGFTVADAGDFNGDSKDDYLIGTSVGKAYLVFGLSSARTAALNLASSSLTKSEVLIFSFTSLGTLDVVVSAAGDMNKDGYDDIALGLPDWDGANSGTDQGLVVVYYGISATAVSALSSATIALDPATDTTSASTPYFYIRNAQASGSANLRVGASIASVGDLIRDSNNIDDLLIGAPGAAAGGALGGAFIVNGKPKTSGTNTRTAEVVPSTITTGTNGINILPVASGTLAVGFSVAGLGDINGDTYPDALVGTYDTTGDGKAYIIYGGTHTADLQLVASSTTTDKHTVISGEGSATSAFGYSVAAAGDLNNDNYNDFAIGAPAYGTSIGRLYVIKGSNSNAEIADFTVSDSITSGFVFKGAGTANYLGASADGGVDMDFNSDGIDDMVACAPGTLTTTYTGLTGKCYVMYGRTAIASADFAATPPTLATTTPTGITIRGVVATGFGKSVSVVGDVTGDGADDFVIGAPGGGYTPSGGSLITSSGMVYEFHGGTVPTTTTTTGSGFRLGASLLVFVSFFAALMF